MDIRAWTPNRKDREIISSEKGKTWTCSRCSERLSVEFIDDADIPDEEYESMLESLKMVHMDGHFAASLEEKLNGKQGSGSRGKEKEKVSSASGSGAGSGSGCQEEKEETRGGRDTLEIFQVLASSFLGLTD